MIGLHHLFEHQVARSPDAVALIFGGAELSYRQLNARSDALAQQLRALGVCSNVLVGLCVERSLEMVIGVLGILKAGGAYVPIDPAYPAQRIGYIIEDASAPILLTQQSLIAALPATSARLVFLDDGTPESPGPLLESPSFHPTDLAYVIYTSGSTGQPKGVEIEHQSVVNFLTSMQREPGLVAGDAMLALTTLSFDIAGLEIFLPLITGARVVVGTRAMGVDGDAVTEQMNRHGVTLLQATPTTWRLLLASGWEGSKKLKALCGGEPLPADLARQLIPRVAELWNMYGPTETTIWSTCVRVQDPENITIGRPIARTETLILDPALQPVAPGGEGELFIGGAGLARGYHERPKLTEEKFIRHPFTPGARLYRTGDLARLTPTGELDCLGRLDFQVKIRGHRIELGEIETVLANHPSLRQIVVAVADDPGRDKCLVAYFTARSEPPPSPVELREYASERLPQYMLPAAFVRMGEIPQTPNGKTDRKALPAPGPEHRALSRQNEPPLTPTEKSLAVIWSNVLGVSAVGRQDKFFDLGGNSLLAVKVFTDIEKQFGQHLPLATLFTAPTIVELARIIEQPDPQNSRWSSLVAIQPQGTKPRFFCVHGAGGNVILYRALAQHLGTDFPFFGLHSQGLDGKTAPFGTIEEMAAHYIREIQQMQPRGPYYVGGYCMGGTVALEMAQQLMASGHEVALVALFDTYNFQRARATSHLLDVSERIRFHLGNFLTLKPALMMSYLREKIRVARDGELANVLHARSRLPQSAEGTPGRSALRTVHATNDRAADSYQPKPYAGKVTLFNPRLNYAKFPDARMGWGDLIQGGIEVVNLPMNPHAMLMEPAVGALAKELADKINAAATAAIISPRTQPATKARS